MRDGPDFICVGVPKAGTGWLFDQLDAHPDFWMPPVKEILYLNQDFPKMQFLKRLRKPEMIKSGQERVVRRTHLDARDHAFIEHARACKEQPRDLGLYAGLFRAKGDLMSGDISPPYWALDTETIREVGQQCPGTKIILMVRDPVERAWSRISMFYRSGQFELAWLEDPREFRNYIKITPNVSAVHATEIAERWREHAPDTAFHTVLFDDIANAPEKALRDVLLFLGADPDKKRDAVPADYNRKADEEKLPMPETARDVLVKHFAKELRAGADCFGSHARDWAAKYGV